MKTKLLLAGLLLTAFTTTAPAAERLFCKQLAGHHIPPRRAAEVPA